MDFRIEEIIQKLVDASNRHDILAICQLVAKGVVFTEPFAQQPIIGREAYKEDIAGLLSYIPDVKFELISLFGKGDQAAFELKYWGVQSGPRLGEDSGKPPTNKKIEMICAVFVRVNADGLIEEQREYYDTATFLKQLE